MLVETFRLLTQQTEWRVLWNLKGCFAASASWARGYFTRSRSEIWNDRQLSLPAYASRCYRMERGNSVLHLHYNSHNLWPLAMLVEGLWELESSSSWRTTDSPPWKFSRTSMLSFPLCSFAVQPFNWRSPGKVAFFALGIRLGGTHALI